MTLAHLKYRADIDGLRAFAVVSVILFHAFPNFLPGGFVGVDVFFVISGYLITGIIARNIALERFSFVEFYERRIRRIFPALIVVLVVTIFFGWHTQLLHEFKQLGKHVAAASVFMSNLVLYGESGYFDTAAETKPLLHLWSLSIEEQFYLIFPFILLGCARYAKSAIKAVALVFVGSALINLYLSYTNPSAAFYFPLGRFWELMAGSLLALYQVSRPELFANYKTRQLLSLGGFVLMIGSFVLISKDLVFPGWIVVFPVLGTTLLLASGKEALVNKTLLSSRLAVAIGLISYPMYLWHWPMLTLPRVFSGEMSIGAKFVALFLTLCFSIATYKFVEKPFRYGGSGGLKSLVLIFCIAVLGIFGLNDYQRDGFPFRSFVKTNTLPSGFAGGAGSTIEGFCGLDSETKKRFRFCLANTQELPQFALYGDSKAGALYPGLFRTSQEDEHWLFIGGNGPGGAPGSILADNELQKPSDTLTSLAAEAIADNPSIKVVLLATATRSLFTRNGYEFDDAEPNFSRALHGMTNLVKRFTASGKKVVLLVDNPTFPEPADCLRRTSDLQWINDIFPLQSNSLQACQLTLQKHMEITSRYRTLLLELKAVFPDKVYIFDTTPYLCDQTQDQCYLEYQGKSLYDDGDHLSDYASGLIGQPLNQFIQTIR